MSELLRKIRFTALFALPLLFLLFPFIHWMFRPSCDLELVLLDKTVPDQACQKHRGFVWILNNLKYQKRGSFFDPAEDYFGFHPIKGKRYDIKEMPADLGTPDLIYLADTYGVYTDDLQPENRGERSLLIYGGLQREEVEALKNSLKGGSTLIAEFNTLGSPTGSEAKNALEEVLGVKWSGWIGRYFNTLSSSNREIPPWLISNYEAQYHTRWAFTEPGFAFVNQDNTVLILRKGPEVGSNLNFITFTERARQEFPVENYTRYHYWFEIVETAPTADTLAYFNLDATDAGDKMLKDHGLRRVFPAVVRHRAAGCTSYYFAGDFADYSGNLPLWRASFVQPVFAALSGDLDGDQTAFFWKVYYPLVEKIVEQSLLRVHEKTT